MSTRTNKSTLEEAIANDRRTMVPLLLLIFILLPPPNWAQELSYEASSEIEPQHRIHSIPRDSVRSLLQGERDLKAFALRKINGKEPLDTVPFDSFKSSKDPAFGYYLHSTWDEKEFRVEVEQLAPFELFAFPSYERHYLFIEKEPGASPSSLRVFQGNEELSYQPSMNAYPLRDEEELVRVEWEDEASMGQFLSGPPGIL